MDRPSFVFVMTDTQGANVLGGYTGRDLGTENLDRLAARGTRFDRGYTTCPVCTPARGAIFTGLHPTVNGAFANNLAPGDNIRHMGQYFRAAGYRTAYVGKWHLAGLDYFDTGICPDGWQEDYWYDGRRYLDDLTDRETELWRRGLRSVEDLRKHDITSEFTWAHRCTDRAVRFLERAEEDPFVLVVSYDEPHGPATCPPDYVERFAGYEHPIGPAAHDDLKDKPQHHRRWAESCGLKLEASSVRRPRYFGCNSYVDDQIGRVLDAVERHAPPDTWVIYTSDHGDMFGAHRITGKGPAMYEEICRIPFIIRPPEEARRAEVVREPVSHVDLLPTMLELAGADVPPLLHGRSLAGVLRGEAPDLGRAVSVQFTRFSINHDGWGGYQPIRCIVRGDEKLVVNLLYTDELYNLAEDPAEMHNLIGNPDWAETRNALHDLLLERMAAMRDPFRGPCWARRPWRKDVEVEWDRRISRERPDDGFMPTTRAYDTGWEPDQWVKRR